MLLDLIRQNPGLKLLFIAGSLAFLIPFINWVSSVDEPVIHTVIRMVLILMIDLRVRSSFLIEYAASIRGKKLLFNIRNWVFALYNGLLASLLFLIILWPKMNALELALAFQIGLFFAPMTVFFLFLDVHDGYKNKSVVQAADHIKPQHRVIFMFGPVIILVFFGIFTIDTGPTLFDIVILSMLLVSNAPYHLFKYGARLNGPETALSLFLTRPLTRDIIHIFGFVGLVILILYFDL